MNPTINSQPIRNTQPMSGESSTGGNTILLVTHQIGLLSNLADEYLMLSHGQLVDRGFMPGVPA